MPIVSVPRYREFVSLLRKRLPGKRASHCIFVAEYIGSFAAKAGVDHDRAVTAGLLHDLCRTLTNEEMIQRARAYEIPIDDIAAERPILLHGPVAAEEIRRELDVDDEEIYEAIYWHTTGRPGLGRMGQALYVADFAEPTRTYPEAARTREILRADGFDAALRFVAETKSMMASKKATRSPDGEAFLLWLEKELGA
jgi:predicted HD superfamily hydrolase involved in NAD metabolism